MKTAIMVALAVFSCVISSQLRSEEKITKKDSKEILSYLASDELEGRGSGQAGNKKAADFIAGRFKEYGLQPYDDNGYFQHFNYHKTEYTGFLRLRTVRVSVDCTNVVGVIKGFTNRCILFGAHFDHLGIKEGNIYNGADDNASGTTALLELAEAFAKSGKKPKHTLVFVAFSAEEVGLIGSRYYASYPVLPLKNHELMINMDMIGRLRSTGNQWRGLMNVVEWNTNRIITTPVLNLQSGNLSKRIKNLIHKLDDNYPFRFNLTMAGWRSDHAEFNSQGVPVLFFHTGDHPQYHQTTDDEHLINYEGLVNITKFIFNLVGELERSAPDIAPPPPTP